MARHNARLYGVAARVEFIVGDFFALAPRLRAHAIHLSPPWGGPSYSEASAFDLATMQQTCGLPRDGLELFDVAQHVAPSVAYYLPRNTVRSQLKTLARRHASQRCELQEILKRAGKTEWVHVLAAFYDAAPPDWLLKKSPGTHARRVGPFEHG
eukprot:5567157-Prymnesium_polylepis.1